MRCIFCVLTAALLAFVVMSLNGCSWTKQSDGLALCKAYCNSYGEDFSKVKQMSYGTCICDNEEGRNVAEGYSEFLNGKCQGHKVERQ